MDNTHIFTDEQAGARFMLRESTAILNEHGVKFVVVGGWVSYLFHRDLLGHPGTYDVDVLLNSLSIDNGSFDAATEAMLRRGYIRAAKNRFQLHRVLNIDGEQILFHADFLNEHSTADEILELQTGSGRVKSIYTPAMEVVFKYPRYRRLNSGEFTNIDFPSEEAFIATKAIATIVKKRQRDAFDVYITLLDSDDPAALRERWHDLLERDGFFQDANDNLWSAVHEGDAITKIVAVLETLKPHNMPSRIEILDKFNSFLAKPVAKEACLRCGALMRK